MNIDEFKTHITKADIKKHKFKVTNSNGTKEAWRWLKKNKWLNLSKPVTEREFGLIIKAVNSFLQEQLLKGKDVIFPCRMGALEIRKFSTPVEFLNGKLKTKRGVDWKKTLELWWEDKDAYSNKQIVRHDINEAFSVYYNKRKANYTNKGFYWFTPTRDLKRKIRDKINKEGMDALLLSKENELYKHKTDNG